MSSRQKFFRPAVIVVAILIVAIAALVLYETSYVTTTDSFTTEVSCASFSNATTAPGNATSDPSSSTASFLIVEADPGSPYEGMNGSAYHLTAPWPVINVKQGQTVVIHVINCASSEPHGFAITHYFDAGASIPPGKSFTESFVADQKGSFRMFCSIFCAIHPYMQNGQLNVS